MGREDDAAVYEIAYAEAVRALAEQHGVVESFRTRAGLLLSSAAVTTSFLAAQAIRSEVGVFAWLALFSFAGAALLTLAILKPRHWEISVRMDEPISPHLTAEGEITASELRLAIFLRIRQALTENQDELEHLSILLQLAGTLLAIEIVLWIAAIATAA